MELRMYLTGTRPMLHHNARHLADPDSGISKEMKKLTAKRSKTEEDRLELAHLEWLGGLYRDDQLGVVLPAANMRACLIQSARLTRDGKKIERGVMVLDDSPLFVRGKPMTGDVEQYWNNGQGEFVDRQIVVVQRNKIVRCRPIFAEWSAAFDVVVDPEQLDKDDFVQVAERAGKLIGVGDYHGQYGRFDVEVTG